MEVTEVIVPVAKALGSAGIKALLENSSADRCCALAVLNETRILKLENPILLLTHGKSVTALRDTVDPHQAMLFRFDREYMFGPQGLITFRITGTDEKIGYLAIYFSVPIIRFMYYNAYSVDIVKDRGNVNQIYNDLVKQQVKVAGYMVPTKTEFFCGDVKYAVTASMSNADKAELVIKICLDSDTVQYSMHDRDAKPGKR